MANLPIEERLLHYFIAMGAQEKEADRKAPADLSFALGHEKVDAVILKNDDLAQRGKVFESVLRLASLRSSSNQLYLVAPRLLGATIDAEVFRAHGIGLLLYDDRHIDETIQPQPIQSSEQEGASPAQNSEILKELANLKTMHSELQREFASLREEINSLHVIAGRETISTSSLPRREIPHTELAYARDDNQLPSFFTNNPWLDVLSRRGKEDQPIAG